MSNSSVCSSSSMEWYWAKMAKVSGMLSSSIIPVPFTMSMYSSMYSKKVFSAYGAMTSSTLGTVNPPYCWLAALRTISPITPAKEESLFGSLYHRLPCSKPLCKTFSISKIQQFIVSLLDDIS